MTSRSTVSNLTNAGFTMLTDTKYLSSGDYLQPGDILLCINHHVAMNVTKGKKADKAKENPSTPSIPTPVPENTEIIGTAKAKGSMHIRAEAKSGATSYGIVPAGTELKVIEITANNWYKVIYDKAPNNIGYTPNDNNQYYDYTSAEKINPNVKKAKGIPEKKDQNIAGDYKVTASSLNVRNKAGLNYKILTSIPKGTKVYCDGSFTKNGGIKWLYITFNQNGKTYYAFAAGEYLKKVKA
jgi:uncharacterized protein YgiM (DUF1202 family)